MFDRRLFLVGLFFVHVLLHCCLVLGWSSIVDIYRTQSSLEKNESSENSTCDMAEIGQGTSRYNLIFSLCKAVVHSCLFMTLWKMNKFKPRLARSSAGCSRYGQGFLLLWNLSSACLPSIDYKLLAPCVFVRIRFSTGSLSTKNRDFSRSPFSPEAEISSSQYSWILQFGAGVSLFENSLQVCSLYPTKVGSLVGMANSMITLSTLFPQLFLKSIHSDLVRLGCYFVLQQLETTKNIPK